MKKSVQILFLILLIATLWKLTQVMNFLTENAVASDALKKHDLIYLAVYVFVFGMGLFLILKKKD